MAQTPTVSVRGLAFDSLRNAPLPGAMVAIAGTSRSTIADSLGHFRFDSVPSGLHTFTMQHDAIDSLGFSGFSTRARVGPPGGSVIVAVPSFATLWRAACGAGAPPRDSGFVYGHVRDTRTDRPHAGATINLTTDDVGRAGGVRRLRSQTRSDAAGSYTVCGIPTNVALVVRVTTDSFDTVVELPASKQRVQRHDVEIGPTAAPAPTLATAPAPAPATDVAAFTVVVTDSSKNPMSGVDVSFPDLSRTGQTTDAGMVRFVGIPPGAHRVVARRVGFMPVETALTFTADQTLVRRFELSRATQAVQLDSVVTTAPSNVTMNEFDANRRLGIGSFLTRAQLERQEVRRLSEVLASLSGLGLVFGRSRAWIVSKRSAPSSCAMARTPADQERCLRNEGRVYMPETFEKAQGMVRACYARVYLDRTLMNPGHPTEPFDVNTISTADLEGVEYYASASETPFRYNIQNANCGVLVLHTRR